MAVQQAVDHIAQRAAQDQADGAAEQALARVLAQHPDDGRRRHSAQADKKPALPTRRTGQKRKRRTGVVGPHQIEVRRDHHAVAQRKAAHHQGFADLVEHQHQPGQAQPQQQGGGAAGSGCGVAAGRGFGGRHAGWWWQKPVSGAGRSGGWADGRMDERTAGRQAGARATGPCPCAQHCSAAPAPHPKHRPPRPEMPHDRAAVRPAVHFVAMHANQRCGRHVVCRHDLFLIRPLQPLPVGAPTAPWRPPQPPGAPQHDHHRFELFSADRPPRA